MAIIRPGTSLFLFHFSSKQRELRSLTRLFINNIYLLISFPVHYGRHEAGLHQVQPYLSSNNNSVSIMKHTLQFYVVFRNIYDTRIKF
jgi:hypothetical protein